MEIVLTSKNFEEEVMNSDVPVLIDFWASWCGPCRMLALEVEAIAEQYEGKLKVCKVNVDEEEELASSFKVMSIPMLTLIKDKKIVKQAVGYMPKSDLEEFIK